MKKVYIGIDPGKNGGIVRISYSGIFMSKHLIPKIGNDIDIQAFYKLFMDLKEEIELNDYQVHVCIESVHSIFGTSASSNFTFGYVVGIIDTIVIANNLSYSKVQPKEWQKSIWLESEIERESGKKDKNGKLKPGKIQTKLTSLKACKRLFPNIDFRATDRSKIFHDGLIDAALIAEYCRRMNH